jgi:hypothetical protein
MTNDRKAGRGRDEATAAYLVSLLEELAPLAQRNGLPVVAYLLDMALMEAKTAAAQSAQPLDRSKLDSF